MEVQSIVPRKDFYYTELPGKLFEAERELDRALLEAMALRSPIYKVLKEVSEKVGFKISLEDVIERAKKARKILGDILVEFESEV